MKYVQVEIITRMGARYVFPDVPEDYMSVLLKSMDGGPESVVVTNLSGATMVIPRRIIDLLNVNGRVAWRLSLGKIPS